MKYYMFNEFENNEQKDSTKKKLNKKKIWKLIIVLLCILLFVGIVILYNNNDKCKDILDKYVFRKDVYENNLPTIELDSGKNSSVYAFSKYITVLEQNKLKLYNKLGKEETSLDVEISTPIFETNEDYLSIAEKSGQKIYLINNKNIVWQKDVEGKISGISVNKNGYMSVTISGTSYKTVVKTFDSNGNELFTMFLSTANVVDMEISDDNKYLAIAEANFSGIAVQSTIEIVSMEDTKNKTSHIAKTNDLIVNIKYNNKNELICMYDKHIDILNGTQNTRIIDIKDTDVLFSDINLPSKIIKITKKSTGLFSAESELQILNENTKDSKFYPIENVPKSLYVQDNIMAINLGTSALFINGNGWLLKRYQSSQEIQNMVLCNEVAGIISRGKIEIISL